MRLLPLQHTAQRRLFFRSHLLLALLALVGASLLLMVSAPRALACPVCIGPDKVTLSGDGISGTASVTDVSVLASLGMETFMGFEKLTPMAPPTHTGSGIELTRYYQNSGVPSSFGTQGFDHMRYYPGASGQPSYVYYEGPVSDEARQFGEGIGIWRHIGHWYQLTSSQDNAVRLALAAAHAAPLGNATGSSAPPAVSVPPTRSAEPPAIVRLFTTLSLPLMILVVCLGALVASVGYRVLRVRRHPRVAVPADEIAD